MRDIDTIVVHCSATKTSNDIRVSDIRRWHKARGWSDIGYHYVVLLSGELQRGRPVHKTGAGVKGHNVGAIHICLVGGYDDNMKAAMTYSKRQMRTLELFCKHLQKRYKVKDKRIKGHRDFPKVAKACPCFNVREWWSSL